MKTSTEQDQPNIRWARIKEIAAKYDDHLDISEKVTLLQFLQQDIKSHRETLAKQLQTLDQLLGVIDGAPAKRPWMTGAGPAKPRQRRAKGKITTQDAIVKALEHGKEMNIPAIVEAVTELKRKVSKPSINQALGKLVKEKQIKNISRGVYAKA